jgi:23S rRNA pseudouridine1911/1915/1917 synthase
VHRIDRETSGALILAKTQESFLSLKSQFQERDIAKEYHTFVYGAMPKKEDTINRPIGRSRNNFRQWSAQRGARGTLREAVTHYTVLIPGKEVSFVKAEPQTGRTHQIRVHFKAINHPVVCDSLYAPKQKALLGFSRLALHARSIEFKDLDGKSHQIIAPYPEDFETALKIMGSKE